MLLEGRIVVKIENIVSISGESFLVGRNFRSLTNLYPLPFDSTDYDIFQCSNLSDLHYWPIQLVAFKMFLMPLIGLDSFAAYPIENY